MSPTTLQHTSFYIPLLIVYVLTFFASLTVNFINNTYDLLICDSDKCFHQPIFHLLHLRGIEYAFNFTICFEGLGHGIYVKGEGEVAFFSAKRWDRRNRADLIESATPCHDSQVVGLYRDSNPLGLTILAAMSEDYTTAPQHVLQSSKQRLHRLLVDRTTQADMFN